MKRLYTEAEAPRCSPMAGLAYKGLVVLAGVAFVWAPLAWLLLRDAQVMWP